MSSQLTFDAEAAKSCLLVEDFRVLGYPNNRAGRRAYERDQRHGRGCIRIAEPQRPPARHPLLALSDVLHRIEVARLAPPLRELTQEQIDDAIADGTAVETSGAIVPRIGGAAGVNRFWVGANGTWDTTTTTNWSTTSGGAGGASAPTTNDTAIFDSNSGSGTVTLGASVEVGAITATGFTGTWATGSGKSIGINGNGSVSATGNVTLGSGMTITGTALLFWHSGDPGSGGTFTSNGKTWPGNLSVGGTQACPFTLGDASSVTGTVTWTSGSFTAGSFTHVWGGFSSTGSVARTLNLNGASITVNTNTGWTLTGGSVITLNPGTSTVTLTSAQPTWSSSNLTYNNVVFNGFTSGVTMAGTPNTFANLTFTPGAANNNTVTLQTASGWTVTGTLTITGASAASRLWIKTITLGTQVSITAAAVSLTNVDFTDIAAAGAATWSGTMTGDRAGNSGITFTTPAAQAWQSTSGGSWSNPANWTSRVPLPQDDVTINKAFIASQTITIDVTVLGRSVDFTGTTGNPTINRTLSINYVYGSLTLVSAMGSFGNPHSLTFGGRGSYTLTSAGKFSGAGGGWTMDISAPGGTLTLVDNLDISGTANVTLSLTAGTLDAATNNRNVTAGLFSASGGTLTRTVNMGSGTWTLNGTGSVTVWAVGTVANGCTVNCGTSTIVFSATDSGVTKTFQGTNQTYGTLRHIATGNAGLTITGSNTFAALDLECTTARAITLPAGGTQTVGTLTLAGAVGQALSLASSTPGTSTTVTVQAGGSFSISNISRSSDVVFNLAQTLSATQGQTTMISRSARHALTSTQPQTATLVKQPARLLAAAQTSLATLTRQPRKQLAAAQPQSASIGRSVTALLAATQPQSVSLTHAVARFLGAVQTTAATVAGSRLAGVALKAKVAGGLAAVWADGKIRSGWAIAGKLTSRWGS